MNKKIEWLYCEKQASQERIDFVSQKVGVVFPNYFVALMQKCDGGTPKIAAFDYYDESLKFVVGTGIGSFLTFEKGDYEYDDILSCYESSSDLFPQGLVAFADTGGGDYICFDYRKDKANPDPEIVYWFHEAEEGKNVSFVAKNFESFMGMLKEEDDEALIAKLRTEKDL